MYRSGSSLAAWRRWAWSVVPCSSWQFLLSAPEIAREASFGIYLAWKGFATTRNVDLDPRTTAREPGLAAV
jgi:hypothetical protein